MQLSTKKPKPKSIQVTAKDMETGKTKTRTFYETDPVGFWNYFDRIQQQVGDEQRDAATSPSAA